ncbi:MAG: thioredoxin domain-containing protein [Acidobacteriota bacterium]
MRDVYIAVCLAAALAASSLAQTPSCDALTGAKRQLATRLLDTEHPYECCDDTIARCLAARPTCSLAARLADTVCRRVSAGQDEARIRRALSRRARSMVGGGAPATIGKSAAQALGPEAAPVQLAVYACARCPFCSRLVPILAREVRGERFAGKVRMVFRTFPIRGREGSTEGGLAFTAAAAMGKFWEFVLHAYEHFDQFDPARQRVWGEAVGLDGAAFEALMAAPETRESLIASKKEGVVNGIEETPTFFINGRLWVGDLEAVEVLDALDEEVERAGGRQWLQR